MFCIREQRNEMKKKRERIQLEVNRSNCMYEWRWAALPNEMSERQWRETFFSARVNKMKQKAIKPTTRLEKNGSKILVHIYIYCVVRFVHPNDARDRERQSKKEKKECMHTISLLCRQPYKTDEKTVPTHEFRIVLNVWQTPAENWI